MVHKFDAIYENGVFRPVSAVPITDMTRVRLTVDVDSGTSSQSNATQKQRQAMLDLDAELESIVDQSPNDGLSSADHDQILYGKPA